MRPTLDVGPCAVVGKMVPYLLCNLACTSACQEAIAATGHHVLWLPEGMLNADMK